MNFSKFITLCCFFHLTLSFGQSKSSLISFFSEELNYQVKTYSGIGGSMPLGLPKEIKEIKSYRPGLQLGIQVDATQWVTENWGIRGGIAIENRGMKTKARTLNYLTQIIQGNEELKGYFTGIVETNVRNTYLSLPVAAVYALSDAWNLYGGLNISFALDKGFTGYVTSDGDQEGVFVLYDRSEQIKFKEGGRAHYDFSKQVNNFQWGIHLGAEWCLPGKRFVLFPQINYNFNSLLNKDFDAISFKLHNFYFDLGFAYRF